MKAHKLKLKLSSREEMEERFNTELFERVDGIVSEQTKGLGILTRFSFLQENQEKIRVAEKVKLIGEWEKKGLPTRFNNETIGDLLWRMYFGK